MRMKYLMLALLTLAIASCQEPPERALAPNGSYTYGDKNSEIGSDILELEDGSFMLVGGQQDPKTGNYQVMFLKLDAQFREEWTRTIDNPTKNEYARYILKTDDGYAVLVYENPNQYGSANVLFRQYSEDLDLLGQASIPAGENYTGDPITGFYSLPNGGFLLAVPGQEGPRVFKLRSTGALEDQVQLGQIYGYGTNNFLTPTRSGFMAADASNYSGGNASVYHFDEDGELVSQFVSPILNNYGTVIGVSQLTDGNFAVLFGDQYNDNFTGVILDSTGTYIEDLSIDEEGFIFHFEVQEDGKLLFFGNTFSQQNYGYFSGSQTTNNDGLIYQKDSLSDDGDLTTIGGSNSDRIRGIRRLSDGSYALIGQTQSYGAGALDVFLSFYNP